MKISLRNCQPQVRVADRARLVKLLRQAAHLADLDDHWPAGAPLSLVLITPETSADLNGRFLQHEGPTDVLTFDYRDEAGPAPADDPVPGGEILVCPALAVAEAAARSYSISEETVLYLVHGMLHLAGAADGTEAERRAMRAAEGRVLAALAAEFDLTSLFALPAAPPASRRRQARTH